MVLDLKWRVCGGVEGVLFGVLFWCVTFELYLGLVSGVVGRMHEANRECRQD